MAPILILMVPRGLEPWKGLGLLLGQLSLNGLPMRGVQVRVRLLVPERRRLNLSSEEDDGLEEYNAPSKASKDPKDVPLMVSMVPKDAPPIVSKVPKEVVLRKMKTTVRKDRGKRAIEKAEEREAIRFTPVWDLTTDDSAINEGKVSQLVNRASFLVDVDCISNMSNEQLECTLFLH
ncbi:hypothetical protein NE237_005591 [Protea cynaroides]|uniref:Uncharacterized protein n=1 Tax=Protea cynaroides TaxID=273540 RepID=A0A9Q0JT29_9MAGN|nr:hypothetical protein NE237_005591 [Protea cynaroides]